MTDIFVQVQNPRTRKYVLINKTKGQIIEVGKDENPFPDVEIIQYSLAKGAAIKITTLMKAKDLGGRIAARKDPINRYLLAIRQVLNLGIMSTMKLECNLEFTKSRKARIAERKQNMAGRVAVDVHGSVDDSTGAFNVDGTVTAYFSDEKAYAAIKKQKEQIQLAMKKAAYEMAYGMGKGKTITFDTEVKTFSDAVNKAIDKQQSPADAAYDKFKADEKVHHEELKRVVTAMSNAGKPVTAHDVNAAMVDMWELLQKGNIEDVTPRGKTGGLLSPNTTYLYVVKKPMW